MNLSRREQLEADVDLRLLGLLLDASALEEVTLDTLVAYMRAAYGQGYVDALGERRRGELCSRHGYRVPRRGERGHAR